MGRAGSQERACLCSQRVSDRHQGRLGQGRGLPHSLGVTVLNTERWQQRPCGPEGSSSHCSAHTTLLQSPYRVRSCLLACPS